MQKLIRLALMSGLVFGIACGDDDVVVDGGAGDGGVEDGAVDAPDTGDVCEGVPAADQCLTAGARCMGDTLNTCAPNADGCLVRTANDCASVMGGTCSTSGGTGACITDPCAGIEGACDAAATTCEGDTLTVCAANAMGCLVETETDCAAGGNSCIANGTAAMCGDICEGVTNCDMAGNVCDGTELSICAADENGCLVTTVTECADTNMLCSADLDPSACADACPPATDIAVELNCDSGVLGGGGAPLNTMGGSDLIGRYSCSRFGPHDGPENVYRFTNATIARVTVVATRLSGTSDMDLFALAGGAGGDSCTDPATVCQGPADDASSTGTGPVETVRFTARPGELTYIAYDAFGTATDNTAEYSLEVTCDAIPCGDGSLGDFEECDDNNTTDGDGCSASCLIEEGYECTGETGETSSCTFTCGDGMRSSAEACDDGNTDAGDGCSPLCVIEDSYVCVGEEGATSTCEIACGNGEVAGDETCDDGNTDAGDGCDATCNREMGYICLDEPSRCHELALEAEGTLEDADDMWYRPTEGDEGACETSSNVAPFDVIDYTPTATGTITVTALYDDWDGFLFGFDVSADDPVTPDFQLFVDPPADPPFDPVAQVAGCAAAGDDFGGSRVGSRIQMDVTMDTPIQLVVSAFGSGRGDYRLLITYDGFTCGDGFVDAAFGETCDDSGNADGDGCSATCAIEDGSACRGEPSVCNTITCGDGLIDGDEACDDNGTDNGDGCDMACAIEDTYVCAGEPSMCRIPACGDGFIDAGEECDDSNMASGDGCDMSCNEESDTHECTGEPSVCREFMCGDSLIDGDEACDDGNVVVGDGCDAACAEESDTHECTGVPSVCREFVCGDGLIEGASEACDDDNTDNGDGCSMMCMVEDGQICSGEPSVCVEDLCGNGTLDVGELCDDGNRVAGDGCEADCRSAVFTGTLAATDPVWDRRSSCSGDAVLVDANHHFDVVPFTWAGAAEADLRFTAAWTGFDGYLHLYSEPFAPTMLGTANGCLSSNDDFGGRPGSRIASQAVPAGATVNTILSSFYPNTSASSFVGDWTLTVTLAP